MKGALHRIFAFSRFLNVVGGTALVSIVLLTTADVILRSFRRPILGTYEIVAFTGSIVILFSLPFTSWTRSHIFVDFFILKFSGRVRNVFHAATRVFVFCLFFLFGWNMIKYGMDLRKYGEVSSTLRIPFYPLVYALAVCCFVQCLVLLCDLVKICRGEYE
jgi:TRAP-type C4-dicarboxylate transport system permease small subunit